MSIVSRSQNRMNLRLRDITYNLLGQFLHSTDVIGGASSSLEDSRRKIRICQQSRLLGRSTLEITSIHPGSTYPDCPDRRITYRRVSATRARFISFFFHLHGAKKKVPGRKVCAAFALRSPGRGLIIERPKLKGYSRGIVWQLPPAFVIAIARF